jgi:hypothetical protein
MECIARQLAGERCPDDSLLVREHEGWVRNVALIECTLELGKPKRGWNFGGEGTGARWGTRGVSLQATWD